MSPSVPVAVLVSDVHLSHKAPPCRAEQTTEEWYAVMRGYLHQLWAACRPEPFDTPLPILVAGDLFDRWDSPPELINFAIEHWPKTKTYAVPGQHDIPNHSADQIHRSAYETMLRAKVINNLIPEKLTRIHDAVWAVGFPWGCGLDPKGTLSKIWGGQRSCDRVVAVAHTPVWSNKKPFPDAPDDACLGQVMRRFAGWDVVHTGDYHKAAFWNRTLSLPSATPTVFNPGTFMIRRSDEIGQNPMVGILHTDGTVKVHHLDKSQDRFVSAPQVAEAEAVGLDAGDLLKELRSAADRGIDFLQAVARAVASKEFGPLVHKFIDKCLEDK